MKKIFLVSLLFLAAPCFAANDDIANRPELGTAVSGDSLLGVDASASAGSRMRRILFNGVSTDVLAGNGTWFDLSTKAPALGADDNYVTDNEKIAIGTIGDKLDAGDVTTVSTDVETFLGSANLAAMLTNLGIPGLSATTGPVVIVGNAGGSSQVTVPNATVNLPAGDVVNRTASETLTNKTLSTGSVVGTGTTVPVTLMIAASDETTAITAAAGKRKFRAPYAFTLTGVRCSVGTAPTGANLIIDVNETGTTSVLATKVTIEDGEYSSVDATAQPVIGDPGIADNADMSIDFDQVGSTIAGDGVKCTLYGTRVLP